MVQETAGLQLDDLLVRRHGFELRLSLATTAPITALYGANGSGKTTLLHAVAGLVPLDRGRSVLGGRVLEDRAAGVRLKPRHRRVGMVFQDLRLFPHLDAKDNVLFGWREGPGGSPLGFDDLVDAFDLRQLHDRLPHELSGGERQRVALARALAPGPELLLLDEPLSAVDAAQRRQILPYLRWVHGRLGIPMVYVSHNLGEILELTDTIAVLDQGSLLGVGEVFETLERTLHGRVGQDFEARASLPVVVDFPHEGGAWVAAFVGGQRVLLPFRPLSTGTHGRVGLRPEDVMLAREPLHGVSARNQLRGVIERITGLHGRLLVHVSVGPDAVLRAEITEDARAELGLARGGAVWCVVKTSAFQWL